MNEEVEVGNVEQDLNNNVESETQRPVKITDMDRMNVELMKSQRREALANAKAALAEQEKIEAQHQMFIQNLFNKYGLSGQDKIDENGNIVYGGATNG